MVSFELLYIVICILLPVLVLSIGLLIWRRVGVDAKGKGTIIPQYDPPTDLSPAEVGVLYDYHFADREVTATLIDLVLQKYVAIHQRADKHFFGDKVVYEFELLRDDGVLDLRYHEQAILDGLFGVVTVKRNARTQAQVSDPTARAQITAYPADTVSLIGRRISIDELAPYFFQYVTEAHQQTLRTLTQRGYFKSDPDIAGVSFGMSGLLLGALAFFIHGVLLISIVVCAVIALLFGLIMRARTSRGTKAKEYIDGFLYYLRVAEKDRLYTLQSPHKAIRKGEVVALYEKYLPYAIALGLVDEWSAQFSGSYVQRTPLTSREEVTRLAASVQAAFIA
jgi:hypothetical protein